jgi:hypothetical protein
MKSARRQPRAVRAAQAAAAAFRRSKPSAARRIVLTYNPTPTKVKVSSENLRICNYRFVCTFYLTSIISPKKIVVALLNFTLKGHGFVKGDL